jgi:midasin (ATPase involved in ribosome maturation)
MAVDFQTFVSIAPHVLAVKKPLMLRGRHGIGKSELVYQIGADMGLPVVERRASQMTEGDLVGLPNTDGAVTSFCPPDWLADACSRPVLLFLDEVDRAIPEVRQGIFELTDSRKIFGNFLHEDTVVVAAVNGGEHGSQYQVGEMDPAELDRWTVFDVEPSTEDWLTWAKTNVVDVVWDFINQNRTHLEHGEDFEPNKVYPSRRSWKRLNDCLATANLVTDHNPLVFQLATGFVGFEAAVAFNDFFKNYERQVTVEMILDEGKIEKTEEFTLNEHCALIEKMDSSDTFQHELTEQQCLNLANYFVSLPSEAVMKLWQALGKGDSNNVTSFHKTKADNGETVSGKLVKILTGK